MKDPIGDINKRIEELEPLQQKDQAYLNKLQQEFSSVNMRMIARQGAINELKKLLSLENVLKDGEVISTYNTASGKTSTETNTTFDKIITETDTTESGVK